MSSIQSDLSKFIETKLKLDELQKRHDKYRKIIEEHMIQEGLNTIHHKIENQSYKIKKSLMSRESISKKELPQEIWDKYCKSSSYSTLRISKIKE
jgi:hypothetical protein